MNTTRTIDPDVDLYTGCDGYFLKARREGIRGIGGGGGPVIRWAVFDKFEKPDPGPRSRIATTYRNIQLSWVLGNGPNVGVKFAH